MSPIQTVFRRLAEDSGEVACCLLGRVEVLIAFHRKYRERAFPLRIFPAVHEQFEARLRVGALGLAAH